MWRWRSLRLRGRDITNTAGEAALALAGELAGKPTVSQPVPVALSLEATAVPPPAQAVTDPASHRPVPLHSHLSAQAAALLVYSYTHPLTSVTDDDPLLPPLECDSDCSDTDDDSCSDRDDDEPVAAPYEPCGDLPVPQAKSAPLPAQAAAEGDCDGDGGSPPEGELGWVLRAATSHYLTWTS